jgi:hypothetical protein
MQRKGKDRKKENYNELTKTLKKTVFKKKDTKSMLKEMVMVLSTNVGIPLSASLRKKQH